MRAAASLLFGAMLAMTLGTESKADIAGHCMAGDGPNGCVTGRVTDAEGILKPGLHVAFDRPTSRYDHGVLGDAVEWGSLYWLQQGSAEHGPYFIVELNLPKSRVFEDVAPRLADLDGNGSLEIVVVETDVKRGAQLAVYALDVEQEQLKKIAATPFIGETHRWLAPAGTGDFDGDGRPEIAYVDRPHLRRELVFLRYDGKSLTEIARIPNLTNHQIGDDHITGGTRNCGQGDELVLMDAQWQNVVTVSLRNPVPRILGPAASLPKALACKL